MHTKKPQYSIAVYKISGITNNLYYKVYLQEGYKIDSINVTLSFECPNCNELGYVSIPKTISVNDNTSVIYDEFSLSNYDIGNNTLMRLDINSVDGANGNVPIDSYTTFRLGR